MPDIELRSLRERLIASALDWERAFGNAPSITSVLSELDAALLLGMKLDDYSACMQTASAVRRGYDFEFSGIRYQVKGNRPSGKRGSLVTMVPKARNYEWDVLIWVLYDKYYEVQEAWLWEVDAYRAAFNAIKRLSPKHLRTGTRIDVELAAGRREEQVASPARRTEVQCVGVDGAGSGWIAAWKSDGRLEFAVYADARLLLDAHGDTAVIAVDVPIGLSDKGSRSSDALARAFVGGRRASSIFSSPVRGVLAAGSQPEASQLHREIDGRGFGAQSFAILGKIREWDSLLREDACVRSRVFEVHPEVCFAAMDGIRGLEASKKTDEGAARRIALLSNTFDRLEIDDLLARVPRRAAARDDVLDSLAALWTAERIATGRAASLPDPVEIDSAGLTRAIYY